MKTWQPLSWDTDVSNEAFAFSWMERLSLICFIAIFLFSTLVLCMNHFYWHYEQVSYFWNGMGQLLCFYLFSFLGSFFLKGLSSRWTEGFFYLFLYQAICLLCMYTATAIQVTPFVPIDSWLVKIDQFFYYDTVAILEFLSHHPFLRKILTKAYNFIELELLLLPMFCIFMRQYHSLKQFFFLLVSTTLIGSAFYFFWPTMAPASVLKSIHFLEEEHNTGLKFYEIHHGISASSSSGGLISMPSFHVIWAILCQHLAWRIRWLWFGLLPMNILVILSALFLGWHYLADFWGSVLVIAMACGLGWLYKNKFCKKTSESCLLKLSF